MRRLRKDSSEGGEATMDEAWLRAAFAATTAATVHLALTKTLSAVSIPKTWRAICIVKCSFIGTNSSR